MGSGPPRVEWSRNWVGSHYCFYLMIKFANKTANIKYKETYQFTLLCKGDQVTHSKQKKSF